jgi:seryl-tRNA synthetase
MIDIKLIRDNPELVKKAVTDKGMRVDIDALLEVDARRRELETEFNDLRHQQKQAGEKIAKASKEEKAELSKSMGALKGRLKQIDETRGAVEEELRQLLVLVPQIPDAEAPIGPDESGNVEIRRVGAPRRRADFGFAFRDHEQLGLDLGLFDIERGVKLAGARNYVLTGHGAMLHEAVLRLAFDLMIERGFTPLMVPVLVNERLMEGTGFFPLHREEVYLAERDNKCLVGTAEVPVTGLHADEILDADELPKRYVARSGCFRREAGAAGRDTRGLYRIHYFEKLEAVVVCEAEAETSTRMHQEIMDCAEALLGALELPYRVLEICTGDMGQGKVRQYDIETWMPGRDAYGETHSASKYHDFQARRLNIRYRDADGKPRFCHTLNTTIAASPRILIPLLESNQQADGSIALPSALRKYCQGRERLEPPR